MAKEEILNQLAEAVVDGDEDLAEEFSQKVLEEGLDPYEAIVEGLAKGMKIISSCNFRHNCSLFPPDRKDEMLLQYIRCFSIVAPSWWCMG